MKRNQAQIRKRLKCSLKSAPAGEGERLFCPRRLYLYKLSGRAAAEGSVGPVPALACQVLSPGGAVPVSV